MPCPVELVCHCRIGVRRSGGVKRNTSFSPQWRSVAGIRGAGFRWRPAVWRPVFTSLIPSVEPNWETAFTPELMLNRSKQSQRRKSSGSEKRSAGFQHGVMVKQTATSRAGGWRSGAGEHDGARFVPNRSTFDTPKTHGISCARLTILAAAG